MNDHEITLYHAPRTRAERPKRLLDAFAIPHRLITIDREAGEHETEAYREVNPLGRVPALRHGDRVILESGAICLYLADLFADRGLAPPPGTPARGRYYETFFTFLTTLEPLVLAAGSPERRDEVRAEIGEVLEVFVDRIEGPFVAGEELTAADVLAHTELHWYRLLGVCPEDLEELDAYFDRVDERLD